MLRNLASIENVGNTKTLSLARVAPQAADERNPSQFIVTTFHPQIIQQADKIYGVSHKNRISQCAVTPVPWSTVSM